MSILNALRSGVKIANKVTKPVQTTVSFKRTTTGNEYGVGNASPVDLPVILETKTRQVRTQSGIEVTTYSVLTILDVAKIVEVTSGLGFIKATDVFILPDGSQSAITATGGFIDAGTGHPIATEVTLG